MGKEKVETSSLCHSQCCASSHTSTQFLISVFLKRDWRPHRTHRQKTWIMIPASRALVIIWSDGFQMSMWTTIDFKLFEVPCKTPQKCLKTILIHAVFFSFWLQQAHATFCTDAWHSVESFCCQHDKAQLSSHDENPSKLHPGMLELLNFLLHTE